MKLQLARAEPQRVAVPQRARLSGAQVLAVHKRPVAAPEVTNGIPERLPPDFGVLAGDQMIRQDHVTRRDAADYGAVFPERK